MFRTGIPFFFSLWPSFTWDTNPNPSLKQDHDSPTGALEVPSG